MARARITDPVLTPYSLLMNTTETRWGAGVNAEAISTSEIRISVVCRDTDVPAARFKALGHPVRLGIALRLAEEPDSTVHGWSLEVRDGAVIELIGPCETSAERERQAEAEHDQHQRHRDKDRGNERDCGLAHQAPQTRRA